MNFGKEKQTQTEEDKMVSYLVSSTTSGSFTELPVFDPSSTQHKARLYHWCRNHWPVFCRSLHHQNPIYYHECCNSFSRRRFSKLAGHPSLQTSSLVTIPSFKEVASAEDFFRWLLKMLTFNSKKGHQCRFPALNRYHSEQDTKVGQVVEEEEPMYFLKKRIDDLNRELYSMQDKLIETQTENKRLMKSTMNWYQKYQETFDTADKVPVEYQTPQKVGPKYSFPFEDDN